MSVENLDYWLKRHVNGELAEIEREIVTPDLPVLRTEFLRGRHAALANLMVSLERAENPVDNAGEGGEVYPL